METRITAVANQKGGVGKTTTAHALACGLALMGRSVLAVDMDPQGNLSWTMGADPDPPPPGMYEAMRGTAGPGEAIQRAGRCDIIAASLMLAGADMEFSGTGREHILRKLLEPLLGWYAHIVIDSPPALGILTINALAAAHDIVVPLGADAYSLQGLAQLDATVRAVREYCNPALEYAGLLVTRHNGRTVLGREFAQVVAEKARLIGAPVYRTAIRESVAAKEAQARRQSIYDGDAGKSNAAKDYMAFAEEYLKGTAAHG